MIGAIPSTTHTSARGNDRRSSTFRASHATSRGADHGSRTRQRCRRQGTAPSRTRPARSRVTRRCRPRARWIRRRAPLTTRQVTRRTPHATRRASRYFRHKEAASPSGLFVSPMTRFNLRLSAVRCVQRDRPQPPRKNYFHLGSSRLTPNIAFCHIWRLRNGKANSNRSACIAVPIAWM